MTSKEMYEMRQSGATYKQIATEMGTTAQTVANRIKTYLQRQAGARGKGFNIAVIPYKGIYEYFASRYYLSIAEFCRKAFGKENAQQAMNMRNLHDVKKEMTENDFKE